MITFEGAPGEADKVSDIIPLDFAARLLGAKLTVRRVSGN